MSTKGEMMEEYLRHYFLSRGFFVIRGAKFVYDSSDVTDVDLWLYNRSSVVSREKIIVDVKNKRTPQAIERILWTRGLMSALRVNGAMVATTEKKERIKQFGKLNNVTVLDGHFLNELKSIKLERLSEEELFASLKVSKDVKITNDFPRRYENLKSLMIGPSDFSSANVLLAEIKYFAEQIIINPQRLTEAYRLFLCTISYFLILMDFLLRDMTFLSEQERIQKIDEGFKFGKLGKEGIERTLELAINISGQSTGLKARYMQQYDGLPVQILREFFSKSNNVSGLFAIAKNVENLAFNRNVKIPTQLETQEKSILFLLLDFLGIDRTKFASSFIPPGN